MARYRRGYVIRRLSGRPSTAYTVYKCLTVSSWTSATGFLVSRVLVSLHAGVCAYVCDCIRACADTCVGTVACAELVFLLILILMLEPVLVLMLVLVGLCPLVLCLCPLPCVVLYACNTERLMAWLGLACAIIVLQLCYMHAHERTQPCVCDDWRNH